MEIRFTVEPDPVAHKRAIRFVSRRNLRILYALGGIWFVFGVFEVEQFVQYDDTWQLLLGVLFLGLAGYYAGYYQWRAVQRAAANVGRDFQSPHEFVITDQTLTVASVYGSSQLRWQAFLRAVELPGQILLFLTRTRFMSLPTGQLTSEQLGQLRTFLAQRNWSMQLRPVGPTQAVAGQ